MKNKLLHWNLILSPLHFILGASITLGLILTTSNLREWALSTIVVLLQCFLFLTVPNFIYYLIKRKKGWTITQMIKSIFYPTPFYISMALIGLIFIIIS